MSIAEALKIEGKIEGKEEMTIQFISGLLKIGMDADTIAATFNLPLSKVKEIILKIKKG